jgi:hypothetical protein
MIKVSRPVGRPRKPKPTKPIENLGEHFGEKT